MGQTKNELGRAQIASHVTSTLNIDMVSAGDAALRAWSKEDEPEELIVVEIYLRMKAAEYSLTIPALP